MIEKSFLLSRISRLSIDWNISINIHLSLSRNWSRSFTHTHTQKSQKDWSDWVFKWNSGIKDLSQKLQRRYFRRLITNYSELLIFQFVAERVVQITESDVGANENLYIKKETW